MKILFITSNRIGDAVLASGVLGWIVERYPGAKLTIACGPFASDLFRAVPGLERLIILRKKPLNRHWIDLWAECVGTRWDLIVDQRNSLAARLLFTKQRAHRAGSTGEHKVVENARIFGITPPPAPHIWIDDQAKQNAARLLPQKRPLIAMGPTANWMPKQWPVEKFTALAEKLTAPGGPFPGSPVIIIASEPERALVAPMLAKLPADVCVPVIGHDLLTVAACIRECALFVGNDSGLMHIAAAMGIPTLGLFGPGYEEIYGPWGPHCAFVRTPEKREELLGRLRPGTPEPNLMSSLGVDSVYAAACGLIEKSSVPG